MKNALKWLSPNDKLIKELKAEIAKLPKDGKKMVDFRYQRLLK